MPSLRAMLSAGTVVFWLGTLQSTLPARAATGEPAPRAQDEATTADQRPLESLLFPTVDEAALQARGSTILPALARLYERSNETDRAVIAYAFYVIGLPSPDAKRVLMQDIHTANPHLRLPVQWALGRVSNDPDVVDVLLDTMRHDPSPLFRDKAACALAGDQTHLTEAQKVDLFARLIDAMRDPKLQVRDIAYKALVEQTGQSKGFDPDAPLGQRERAIREWERWLEEYRSNM
jgi:HEAT repeats